MLQIQPNNLYVWTIWRDMISQSQLFADLTTEMIDQALLALNARIRDYQKDELILWTGDRVGWMGLLLTGTIEVSRQDGLGNVFIVTQLHPPTLFAEALVCAGISASPVDIRVTEPSTALLLDFNSLLMMNQDAWSGRSLLMARMMQVLSRKNLMLNQKLDIMSRRSTRARVAAVLLIQMAEQGKRSVVLPYNRQQLADYLAVDRSALSRELSHMKKENLIDYHRRAFDILDPAALASYA